MSDKINNTFKYYCEMIENFSSCMNDYLYIIDFINDQYYISTQACKRFALPGNSFSNVNDTHRSFVYPKDYPMLMDNLRQLVAGEISEHNLKYRWIGVDGNPIWINCRGRVLLDKNGQIEYMIGCINEIGQKPIADNTTGLLGEMAFIHDINEKDTLSDGFILRIGIDDFKKINEKNGISYGDRVLQQIGHILSLCTNENQTIYRIVADEFLITDFSGGTFEDAKALYKQFRDKIDVSLEEQQYEIVYTISGGILLTSDLETKSTDEILKLSQFSLSQAKANGKNQYYPFKIDDYNAFLRQRQLEKIFRNAVAHNFEGFSLNYQPIVYANNNHVFAAEALLRFKTKDGESISPFEMIPCLEDTGLIIPVGKWIMYTALSDCKEYCIHHPDFKVSINLSYVQLLKSDVFEDLSKTIDELGLSGNNVIVELTESGSLENNINIIHTWHALKKFGVAIAIDDFGSGYSNFSHIGDLHPDFVKIDHAFTFKAFENEYNFHLLQNIIHMAHNLDLEFVVEGVETDFQKNELIKFKPEYIQGFYFGRPCDKAAFISKFFTK